jgi:hypothetical protein
MKYRIAAQVTAPALGAGHNDDALGHAMTEAGLYAWVIDGSTSVADEDYVSPETGDVAWFATSLSEALAKRAPEASSPRELHALAAADVAVAYADALAGARPPLHAQPTGAVTIVRVTLERLELYQLGDCSAFAWDGAGAQRLGFSEASDANGDAIQRIKERQATYGYEMKAVWEAERAWERQNRQARLQRARFNVSTPSAEDRFDGREASFALDGVHAIVLMSDGFERFTMEFAVGDDTDMVRSLVELGPERVLSQIRVLEAADANCRLYPRVKVSDDATCLVLRKG